MAMNYLVPIYSTTQSEMEIQAELYHQIKALGLEPKMAVRGYLHAPHMPKQRRKCIFDIVVFWPLNHRPICIVECKKGISVHSESRQIAKYSQFDFPLLLCFRNNSSAVIQQITKLAQNDFHNAPPSMRKEAAWTNYIEELDNTP